MPYLPTGVLREHLTLIVHPLDWPLITQSQSQQGFRAVLKVSNPFFLPSTLIKAWKE